MLCLMTNISGSKFVPLFDCSGEHWYTRLAESWVRLELGEKGFKPFWQYCHSEPPPVSLIPSKKEDPWIAAVLLTHLNVSSYFEILHCSCDIISSSSFRSVECSLFLCGFSSYVVLLF